MKKSLSICSLFGTLWLLSSTVNAAVPPLLPVQGLLTDPQTGQAQQGPVDMVFSLYASEGAASALWTETYNAGTQVIDLNEGQFVAYLGQISPLDFGLFAANAELWLGVTVNADSEMPRIRLAAVPFAIEAQTCQELGALTTDDAGLLTNLIDSPCPVDTYFSGWDTDGNPICQSTAHTHAEYQYTIESASCAYGIESIASNGGITCAANNDTTDDTVSWDEISGLVGTTASTVAAGDHTHSYQDIIEGVTCAYGIAEITAAGLVTCAPNNDTNTTYAAGTGLTLSGTTFSANTSVVQSRVSGTCATGSAINTVGSNGTVTCQPVASKSTVLTTSCKSLASFTSTYSLLADIGSFTKINAGSTVQVNFNGRLAVAGTLSSTGAVFELRVDGAATTNGVARVAFKSSEIGPDGIQASMTGVFTGLSAGTHLVSMYVHAAGAANATGTNAYIDYGCWSSTHTVVTEMP